MNFEANIREPRDEVNAGGGTRYLIRGLVPPGTVRSRIQRVLYATMFVLFLFGMLLIAIFQAETVATHVASRYGWELILGLGAPLGLLALFAILERWRPAGPRKSLAGWALNLEVMLFGNLIGPLSGAVLGAALARLGGQMNLGLIDLRPATGLEPLDAVLAFILFVLVFDFFYYWFHRFQHENRYLWQQHKLHHLDEQLNVSTVMRDHPLEALFQAAAITIPMNLLFKLTPTQGGLLGMLFIGWLVFIHANLPIGFGRLAPLVVAPQTHRIHHSRLPEHLDKNFAAFFPIWDVLFGTYFHPRPGEYPPTGVHDARDVRGFWEAMLLPFREWWHMLRSRPAA